ncbi:histone-lysine N-methyltransferase SETMAR [Trichonephila clavipes]|nr:histone-lysine N-methyltransferase SETMAR [Trichonephila clavipes]
METLIPSPAACEVRLISRSLLHEIVTKPLLFKKLCVRWVPKDLAPEHKIQHLEAALTFLQRYHDDGDEFLDRIITGDETWISHFTPEIKQQSMHWWYSGSLVRTKFEQMLSVRKVMCTVLWDRKGILLIDFLLRGETVNVDRYYETLRKSRRAIQNKRCGMLNAGVVLLRDNARSHTARRTAAVLTEFGWELFDQPQPPTALILLSAIFTFSCTSRNSCPPVSVLATRKS